MKAVDFILKAQEKLKIVLEKEEAVKKENYEEAAKLLEKEQAIDLGEVTQDELKELGDYFKE